MLSQQFVRNHDEGLNITICSFGYPTELPRDADLVFDVRFLLTRIMTGCLDSISVKMRKSANIL
jgi:RNase adaptor protein for sRNA GlmZ degradation